MIATTVTYHADGYGPARPGINVKDRHSGMDFVRELERLVGDAALVMGDSVNCIYPSDLRDIAYTRVCSDFWQSAEELADQYGIGPITQEGRSGGWLAFDKAPDLDENTADTRAWIKGYRALSAWAEEYIADAPARTARLAQDMKLDEIGSRAVNRPYLAGA